MVNDFAFGLALLGTTVVLGTDVFFCIVGRTALARVSDAALVETMGHVHAVADRRMPAFGIAGLAGTLAGMALSRAALPFAAAALVAQIAWILVYRRVAAPVNATLTRHAAAGTVPPDARALQARWDSVIVARVALLGAAFAALLVAGSVS